MEYRYFQPADMEQVVHLVDENRRQLFGDNLMKTVSPSHLAEMIGNTTGQVMVAVTGTELAGFIWWELQEEVLFIQAIVVGARWTGEGAGGELIARAFDEACRQSLKAVGLSVMQDNSRMLRLVKSMGFRQQSVGRDPVYLELPTPC